MTSIDQSTQMRPLPVHVIPLLLVFASCDDVLRPAAIIPWSQYQQRLKEAKEFPGTYYSELEEKLPPHRSSSNSVSRSRWLQNNLKHEKPEMTKMNSRPRSVIRSQLRNRLPVDLSTTTRNYLIARKQPLTTTEQTTTSPKIYHIPHVASNVGAKLQRSSLRPISIPNGVPVHAGVWDDGKPQYATQRRPQQFAAATLGSVNPLSSLTQNHFVPSPLNTAVEDSIANSIFSQTKAGTQTSDAAIQAAQATKPAVNPLDSLLGGGAPLDQISKIASNILNFGGGEGPKGGLLEAMTNVLRRSSLPAPTTSFQDDFPFGSAKPQPTIMEKLITQAASALNQSLKDKEAKEAKEEFKQKEIHLTKDKEDSLKLLENLPEEERKLLKAAITSGELDAETLAPALKSLVKEDTREDSKKEKESRLIEWIRENRPTNKHKEITVSADKLPYYGKYCGSFAEQINSKKKFKPSGALWVVDEKRFIISKFIFQPGSLLSGPLVHTENILADMFPSANGFYVRPQPIDVSIFALEELPPLKAKARKMLPGNVFVNGTQPIEPIGDKEKKATDFLRLRRDAPSLEKNGIPSSDSSRKPVELLLKGGTIQLNGGSSRNVLQTTQQDDVHSSSLSSFNTIGPAGFRVLQPEDDRINYNNAQPLEWFAGFQPLLLTLPEGRTTKSIHWVSLRDHKRQETVASVLLPNGPAFQIPGVVSLRGFSPNGGFNVSSGPIRVTDIKTMEISNFTLRAGGNPVWFMIGKDILPNAQGHIVPIYDPKLKLFDCESLRDYYGETVLLRLPGNLDIKDVFWFSVFSITNAVSYTHIYLPYNDIQLPPDMNGIPIKEDPSKKINPAG